MSQILIFKTSVDCAEDADRLATHFLNTKRINRWSFDLRDCDKVLRIECYGIHPKTIENLLQAEGFNCEHLEYEL